MTSIGIFGGTFDPPHIAHLILASEARAQLGLERLLWVLTPDPPHKQNQSIAPLQHRLEMVRLAIADDPQFELSRVDIDRPGPHYALDTLSILANQDPDVKLVYIMGGDSLRDLPTWYQPSEFVANCHAIGVVQRPGAVIDLAQLEQTLPGLRSRLRLVQAPLLDISAHDIRNRVAGERPFRYFLPEQVYRYILSHGLYRKVKLRS